MYRVFIELRVRVYGILRTLSSIKYGGREERDTERERERERTGLFIFIHLFIPAMTQGYRLHASFDS